MTVKRSRLRTSGRVAAGRAVGVPAGARLTARLKRLEAALRDREFKLAAIVDNSPSALSLKSPDGRYALANPNLQRIHHCTEAEILGRTDFDLYPEAVARAFRGNDERVLHTRQGLSVEEQVPVDGRIRTFMSHMFPVLDATGAARYVCRISLDVTDRKRAEAELRDSEARFRATFEQAAVGIAHLSPGGGWLRVNQKLCEIVGRTRDALMGLAFRDIVHPEDLVAELGQLERLLAGAIDSFRLEMRCLCGDGALAWIHLTAALVRAADGAPDYLIAVVEDIGQRKAAERRAREAAQHDPLTGLPNRALAFEYGARLVAAARRGHGGGALLFVDLDRFKAINDTHGHEAGDRVLQEIARRLRAGTRAEDLVARIGGDEFLVFLPDTQPNRRRAAIVARHLIGSIGQPCRVGALALQLTPSIGISLYPEHGADLDALVHAADLAMYQAKQGGRAGYRLYSVELERRAEEAQSLETRLRRALGQGGLVLHYQPVVDIATGRLVAAEALLRLRGDAGELIGPGLLVPVAESTGLIGPLGTWVAEEACRQIAAWRAEGLPALAIAINVSPLQFRQRGFARQLLAAVTQAAVEPGNLQLEVTESTLMEDVTEVTGVLQELQAHGMKVALDDFGTGYSSLGLLTTLPLDKIKIDQCFVRRFEHEEASLAVTRAIVALGTTLSLEVVGEGIETPSAMETLRAIGCHQAQGYLISRPLPPDTFTHWCRERPC